MLLQNSIKEKFMKISLAFAIIITVSVMALHAINLPNRTAPTTNVYGAGFARSSAIVTEEDSVLMQNAVR
jgi:hypothetical protein